MATKFSLKKALFAVALILMLAPTPVLAADPIGQYTEGNGPVKIFLSGGGCQNCLLAGERPACDTPCQMPLLATIQNLSDHTGITVEVTMSFTFPWTPGPGRCGQEDFVQVESSDLSPWGQVTIDFTHRFTGPFRGAIFMMTTVITAADNPDLIGKTQVEFIPVRTFWFLCDN